MSGQDSLLLSVILPNYNHGHYLEERLHSILEQLPSESEILLIDDASTDNSVEIVERIAAEEPRILLIRNEKNLGVNLSVNNAIKIARGKYITPLAADDILMPGCIESYLSVLQAHPEIPLCGSDNAAIYETDPRYVKGEIYRYEILPGVKETLVMAPEDVMEFVREKDFALSGTMVMGKREAFLEEGCYRPELQSISDWFVTRRIAFRGGMIFIPEVLVLWRQTGNNYGINVDKDDRGKFNSILEMFRILSRSEEKTMRTAFRRSAAFYAWMNDYFWEFLKRPQYYDFFFSMLKKKWHRRLLKHRNSLKKLPQKWGLAKQKQCL